MSVIGKLIYTYRKENNLTQNEVVERLSTFSTNLYRLNTVTLSRWETGVTSPGIDKKRSILKFLLTNIESEDSTVFEMIKKQYRLLSLAVESPLTIPNAAILGNFPIFNEGKDFLINLQECEDPNGFLEYIVDIERSTHVPGYCQLSKEKLKMYLQEPSSLLVVSALKSHCFGHFVMLKIKDESVDDIVHNRRNKYDIGVEDLCSKEESGSYILLATYAINPKYALKLRIEAYLFLLDNISTIKDFIIFSTRTEGESVCKTYGLKEVAKGKDEQYGFNWFGLLAPVEDVLFSDTVIKLVF